MGDMDIKYYITIKNSEIIHLVKTKDVKIMDMCLANLDVDISQNGNEYEIIWSSQKFLYMSVEFVSLLFENTVLPILSFVQEQVKVDFFVSNVGYELISNIGDYVFDFRQELSKFNNFVILIFKSSAYKAYFTKDVKIYSKSQPPSLSKIQHCLYEYSRLYGSLDKEERLNIFFVEEFPFDGISWSGNIVIKENNVRNYFIIFHELAHQWFNWLMNPSPYWLIEAMADFSSNYILNQHYNLKMSTLLKKQRENYAAWLIYHEDIDLVDCNMVRSSFEREAICHGKSAFFLVNLERELGKEFFCLVQHWLKGTPFWQCCKAFLKESYENFVKQWGKARKQFEVLKVVKKQGKVIVIGLDKMIYPLCISVILKNGEQGCLRLRQEIYNEIPLDDYTVDVKEILLINFDKRFYINGYLTLAKYMIGNGELSLSRRIIKNGLQRYPDEPVLVQILMDLNNSNRCNIN